MKETIAFELNGKAVTVEVDPDRVLLWVLRTELGLTGTKYGCGEGHCGACTVHCPSGALYIERPSMEVKFKGDDCIICLNCLKVCPVRAMEVKI